MTAGALEIGTVNAVLAHHAFVAFTHVLHGKVRDGERLFAYRMLVAIGSSPVTAHEIVESWPAMSNQRQLGLVTGMCISISQEAAVRLACFIPKYAQYDWSTLLEEAVATVIKQSEMKR